MINHTLSLACSILGLAIAANHSSAQEKSRDSNESKRLAWFVQTSIPDGVENPVKMLTGGEIKMLSLYDSVASQPVPVSDDGTLRIVKEVPNPKPDAKEKTIYITLAKAVVPKGVSRALVIMTPAPKPAKDDTVFLTSVQDLNRFKGGDFMYINLSNSRIGVEIGSNKKMVNPGGLEIVRVADGNGEESIPYRYSYFQSDKQRWLPVSASVTIASMLQREVYIFSVNQETGRIRCKGVTFPVM